MKQIIHFNNLKLLAGIILMFLTSCNNREWNNPFDPNCPKEIFTPTNFSAEQKGDELFLSWNQSSANITGYKIEWKIGNENFSAFASLERGQNSIAKLIMEEGKLHTYKLYAYAGSNKSNEVTTTITPVLRASITTSKITNITGSTATSGGTISKDGGSTVTARGVVWYTSPNPTLEGNMGKTNNGTGTGSFTSELTGLNDGTEYFVRAYATNSKGTTYGSVQTFSTLEITLPEVTTAEVTNITTNSAKCGGEVTFDGNSQVTSRGIVLNTTGNPTLENYLGKTEGGSGIGSFISELLSLQDNTIYYIKAYAINGKGVSYGVEKEFKTFDSGIPDVQIWNFSSEEFKSLGNIQETIIINRLTLHAKEDRIMTIDENTKTFEEFNFTHRLKFGGSGKFDESGIPYGRVISFDVLENAKITIIGMSGNSLEDRKINIAAGNKDSIIAVFPALGTELSKGEYNYTGGPSTIFIYSPASGVNIYYLEIELL